MVSSPPFTLAWQPDGLRGLAELCPEAETAVILVFVWWPLLWRVAGSVKVRAADGRLLGFVGGFMSDAVVLCFWFEMFLVSTFAQAVARADGAPRKTITITITASPA